MIEVPQKLAVPFIQATLNTQRLLYNRDVGEIIGQPHSEWIKARPQLRQLTIVFRSRERPPWRHTNGKRCREASYTIPDVRKGLTWEEIKRAASPFTWGKFRATANLDNQRQMAVYGTSEAEAKKKLLQLAQLSDAKIMTISLAEEELRPAKMKKGNMPSFKVSYQRSEWLLIGKRCNSHLSNQIVSYRKGLFPVLVMEPREYSAAVKVFIETISGFLLNWKLKFNPDREELVAMAEAFEKIAQSLREKAVEEQ